jgi:hypothetical protein
MNIVTTQHSSSKPVSVSFMNSEQQQNRYEYKSKSIFSNIKFKNDNRKEDGDHEFAVPA